MAAKFYAVKKGKKTGVFRTWDACKAQVNGFSGAVYKSFPTYEEAQAFVGNEENQKEIPTIESVLRGKHMATAVAYVDGSYYQPAASFSYGAVIALNGKEYQFSERMEDEELATMRNVAGEIKGAECAMKFAVEQECDAVYIYHDYEGIAKWCLGEWKANKKGTQAYKAFYDAAKEKVSIHFVKVKGHSNDKYNDLADLLAKKALGLE